jgi:hypothetical protein
VPGTVRAANEDFILPLGTPIRGKNGEMIDNLKVNKGTGIFLRMSSHAPATSLAFYLAAASQAMRPI